MTPNAALMRLSLLGARPSPAWRALAGRLLRTPTKTRSERPISPKSRSSHLIAVDLEHYTHPPTVQAERVTVHRPLDWSVRGGADTEGGGGVPYLSCHLCTLLLKDNHDVSIPTATRPEILFSFPHTGHVHRHQRPVDPVLLRAARVDCQRCRDEDHGEGLHPSPRRRGRGRGWIDATEIQSVRYPDRRATIHLVSTDRQLTFCSAIRLFEAEHITGDGALDGPRPESKWVLAGTQYNSHRPLHR